MMDARSIGFMRKVLSGNTIETVGTDLTRASRACKQINVKPGTLLDQMGIKTIYTDKYRFDDGRCIFIDGKNFISGKGESCDQFIEISKDNPKDGFLKLKNFFETLFRFRK